MTLMEPLGTDDKPLAPGERVEVRNSFDGRWGRGFEVVSCDGAGYRLRRLSDDTTLPVPFAAGDIRRDRRRQGLWWA